MLYQGKNCFFLSFYHQKPTHESRGYKVNSLENRRWIKFCYTGSARFSLWGTSVNWYTTHTRSTPWRLVAAAIARPLSGFRAARNSVCLHQCLVVFPTVSFFSLLIHFHHYPPFPLHTDVRERPTISCHQHCTIPYLPPTSWATDVATHRCDRCNRLASYKQESSLSFNSLAYC